MRLFSVINFFLKLLEENLPDHFHTISFTLKVENVFSVALFATEIKTKKTYQSCFDLTKPFIDAFECPDEVSLHIQVDRHIKRVRDGIAQPTPL